MIRPKTFCANRQECQDAIDQYLDRQNQAARLMHDALLDEIADVERQPKRRSCSAPVGGDDRIGSRAAETAATSATRPLMARPSGDCAIPYDDTVGGSQPETLTLWQRPRAPITSDVDHDDDDCQRRLALMERELLGMVGDVGLDLGLTPEHMLGARLDDLSASQLDAVDRIHDEIGARIRQAQRQFSQRAVFDLSLEVMQLSARIDQLASRP